MKINTDRANIIRSNGFTLIEFLVVLFILFILAAIAIPDFLKFQAKAKCSESKTNMGSIFTAQVAYYGKHGKFAGHEGDKKCFDLLEWRPEGETLYSYYCDTDVIPNTKGDKNCPEPDVPLVTDKSFTIFVVGNIDNDPICDVWTMNDAKVLRNVVVDP